MEITVYNKDNNPLLTDLLCSVLKRLSTSIEYCLILYSMALQRRGTSLTVACLGQAVSLTKSGTASSMRGRAPISSAVRELHLSRQLSTPNHAHALKQTAQEPGKTVEWDSVGTTSDDKSNKNTSDPPSARPQTPTPPPPPSMEALLQDLQRASQYNQGNTRKVLSKRTARKKYHWDFEFCRQTADAYEYYLLSVAKHPKMLSDSDREALLAPDIVDQAFQVLLRCRLKPSKLSSKVRDWERALGTIAETPLTDQLSMRLLEANGKSGNIGRVLSLLEFRTSQTYKPTKKEYVLAITAVEAAGWFLRQNRNIYLGDHDQPVIDNPTRWLDAILMNMNQRQFPLTVDLAVRMLDTFASRGRTGKAMHYFYSVHRTPYQDEADHYDDDDSDRTYIENANEGVTGIQPSDIESNQSADADTTKNSSRSHRIRLKLKTPPPYYKVPTDVKGKLLPLPPKKDNKSPASEDRRQLKKEGVLKIDRETEPDWSPPLTAAFSFADSLTQGACGHEPIELNLVCYNVLIKACVYRGALWRAMHLLDTVMPSAGVAPDVRSYDTLLSGLARVGDVTLVRDYYQRMLSKGIEPSYYTVQCVVDGLLNLGDVAGAVTVVQDFFNQHSVLPPVETQLKILEFALARDMPYEAKRHVYFIQQLWKWQPHYKYESKEYIYFMKTYQRDPRISREALQNLFDYFGEVLDDSDFF